MARVLKQTEGGVTWLELLLDETICEGPVWIEKEMAVRAGGVNAYLSAKQKYELLIRIAAEQPVAFMDEKLDPDIKYIRFNDDEKNSSGEDGWKTDCYLIGRYGVELQTEGIFDDVITAVLSEAQTAGRETETIAFLEHMIRKDAEYWKLAEGSCDILVYKGDDVCHNVLNIFAEQFGRALSRAGKKVNYFDCEKQDIGELTLYMNQHFQAVIGVQSYLFSVKMKDEVNYLHEYIYGPKYNFIFDHPIWMRTHLKQQYPDFYVLTHDMNYVNFIEKYFHHNAILFPPAGMMSDDIQEKERIYDLTFVGTYGNYWNEVLLIHQLDRKKRFLANHFLLIMRKNPTLTAEGALQEVLKLRGMILSDDEFLELLYDLRRVIYCVMHYYRNRVLRCILQSGIKLDVFGDSWMNCPLISYPNLICHPNVTVEESLDIWKKSKLSLNIMSWHKGGFTERMANIMLAGAVLVTDDTTYLMGKYTDEDLLTFSLEEREKLSDKIKYLLDYEEYRKKIAQNGKQKTLLQHTWDKRAQQFLDILDKRIRTTF